MSYRLLIARPAEKDLDALMPAIRQAVLAEIKSLTDNPRPHGCKKLAGAAHNWRIRVRDYRVLYTLDQAERTVNIYRIKHRSHAYR